MPVNSLILPDKYHAKLDVIQTERAIKLVKDTFEIELADALELTRVSAPLFVRANIGLNDDLNGVERAVCFDIKELGEDVVIVHSLAKWKRYALSRYGFPEGQGIYTDMNAIRRDEDLDNIHSAYVDQWDWEKIITREQRTRQMLENTVKLIIGALVRTQRKLTAVFPQLDAFLSEEVYFVTSQQLEDEYPDLSPKQRENAVCKKHKTVFIMQIGGKLASGKPHDSRAPDYDDWSLNGDILVYNPVLDQALEISSMGIRVDSRALEKQLETAGCTERKSFEFHRLLLEDKLSLTMGGGIGQSRICMLLLQKAHIGEVQASVWTEEMVNACEQKGIRLL